MSKMPEFVRIAANMRQILDHEAIFKNNRFFPSILHQSGGKTNISKGIGHFDIKLDM